MDVAESPLQIVIAEADAHTVVTLVGAAEGPAIPELGKALSRVHDQAVAAKKREVLVDLRDLEFATSSSLKAFVTWLQGVHELAPEARYRVVFQSSPRHHWQARSLHALKAFAGDVVEIR